MHKPIEKARANLAKAHHDVAFYEKQIQRFESNCEHKWTEVKYAPIKDKDRWTRECESCGKQEETTKSDETKQITKTPVF